MMFLQTPPPAADAPQMYTSTGAPNFPAIDHGVWLPEQASTLAPDIDQAWDWAMYVSLVTFFLVTILTVYFAVRYRRRGEGQRSSPVDHSTRLEVAWTVVPTFVVIILFFVGFKGYVNANVPPANALDIQVTAQKWSWFFTYPNGSGTNELVVPAGKPVRMIMSSKDVLHSFFIPEFRVKQDVVPGLYTTLWFEATRPQESVLLCTEYCGTSHSEMLAKVIILEQSDFDAWYAEFGKLTGTPEEIGAKAYRKYQCFTCHSTDGSRLTGPSFKGLWGTPQPTSGGTVVMDENYTRESILDPQAKIVTGYPPSMPPYKGQIKDEEIAGIIAWLKTLK